MLYKGAVIQPFTRLDDGEGYRVSRDQYGNQHYFRIADGQDGADFHTDPQTGAQYTDVPSAGNTSRREVVGQDNFVPLYHQVQGQADAHRAAMNAASLAVNQAEQGVAGAGGHGSYSLAELRNHQASTGARVQNAQDFIDGFDEALRARRGTPDSAQLSQYRDSQAFVEEFGAESQAVNAEIANRQATIDAARQQHTVADTSAKALAELAGRVRAPGFRQAAQQDLSTALQGGDVPPDRGDMYQRLGLVVPSLGADGSPSYQVSARGMSLLPKPKDQAQQPDASGGDWQATVLKEFPRVGVGGSSESEAFLKAFQSVGGDPRKALQAARAVLGK